MFIYCTDIEQTRKELRHHRKGSSSDSVVHQQVRQIPTVRPLIRATNRSQTSGVHPDWQTHQRAHRKVGVSTSRVRFLRTVLTRRAEQLCGLPITEFLKTTENSQEWNDLRSIHLLGGDVILD